MLAGTVWGWAWIAQIVAALAALAACLFARRGSRVAWTLVGIAGVMIAFTLSLSGHALSVERWRALTVLADGVHVLGAAAWLGGLFAVLVVGVPGAMALPEADRGAAVVDLVNAFSPAALVFAGVVTVTGVFAAWQHLGALSALWSSGYGRTLIAKLGVLSVVALTGAYNWLRVRPALGGGAGVRRVRRSATIEVVAALVVLAVTAVLVATPPPLMAPASH
jgi:putative copper export protein